jgi:serine/threonine protein kinase
MSLNCSKCSKVFNFLTAFKYNCAVCSKAFCFACCNCSIVLNAQDLITKSIKDYSKAQKCCQACFDHVSRKASKEEASSKPEDITALYSLGKVLGEGGFGVVKEGISKVDSNKVAVKILLKDKVPPEEENVIYNEVKILTQLHHRNIVRLFHFVVEPTCYYIVMECVVGGELFDRIVKKTVYNELEARELVIVLLNAIKYLHGKNVVHR